MVRKLLALPDRLRGRLAQDDGFALVLALGVSAVLGLLGATVVTYGSANYGAASRSKDDQGAFALAEAGINNAMAVLSNPTNNALDPTLLPPVTSAYEGGTVTWSGALDRATAVWTLTSTGERRNPTGPGAEVVRRTVSAEVPVTPIVTWQLENEAWNSIVATRTGTTCDMNVSSGVTEASPLYVMGNLCLASGARVTGGPLVVKRKLSLANTDSSVGSAGAPITEAHVGVGCNATRGTGTPSGPFQRCTTASGTTPVFENETASPSRRHRWACRATRPSSRSRIPRRCSPISQFEGYGAAAAEYPFRGIFPATEHVY